MDSFFATVGDVLKTVSGIYVFLIACSFFLDKVLNIDSKIQVTKRLNGIVGKRGVANLFLPLFDRLFDPKKKGRPNFWRSGVASFVVMAIISVTWWFFYPERASRTLDKVLEDWQIYATVLILFAISINMIGDFFSLWETRVVIGRMATAGSRKLQAMLLILDLVLTVIIYGLGCVLPTLLFSILARDMGAAWFITGRLFEELFYKGGLIFINLDMSIDPFSIFFYTTLFTSVWVWVFMLGVTLWPLLKWILGKLNVNKYPVLVTTVVGEIFLFPILAVILAVVRL